MKQFLFFVCTTVALVMNAMDNSQQKTYEEWLREYQELQLTLSLAPSDTLLLQINITTLERMIQHAPCFKNTIALGWSAFRPKVAHRESLTGFMAHKKLDLQEWVETNRVASISKEICEYLVVYFVERQLWATNLYETNRAIRERYFAQDTEGLQRIEECYKQRMATIEASQQLMEQLVVQNNK